MKTNSELNTLLDSITEKYTLFIHFGNIDTSLEVVNIVPDMHSSVEHEVAQRLKKYLEKSILFQNFIKDLHRFTEYPDNPQPYPSLLHISHKRKSDFKENKTSKFLTEPLFELYRTNRKSDDKEDYENGFFYYTLISTKLNISISLYSDYTSYFAHILMSSLDNVINLLFESNKDLKEKISSY